MYVYICTHSGSFRCINATTLCPRARQAWWIARLTGSLESTLAILRPTRGVLVPEARGYLLSCQMVWHLTPLASAFLGPAKVLHVALMPTVLALKVSLSVNGLICGALTKGTCNGLMRRVRSVT